MGSPSRKCLHVLQKICRSRRVLPSTYEVSGKLSFSTMGVVAYGGFCDVYKGSLGGADVCVKRLRVSNTGDQANIKKVSRSENRRLDPCALISFGGTLQGGCDVETPRPSEHCAIQGCHVRAPSTRVRMDGGWRVEKIYRGQSARKLG